MRDRVLAAAAMAVRRRCERVESAEVLERDGLVLSLTNLPEPSLNAADVERDPPDPDRALAWAEDEMTRRGHGFGIEIPAGRFPALDRAVRDAGLERLRSRPMMVAEVSAVPDAAPPAGVEIQPVRDRAEAA